MLYLHRNQIISAGIVLCFSVFFIQNVFSQGVKRSYNYDSRFKNKNFYFGIRLGSSNNDYRIQRSDEFILNNRFAKVNSISGLSGDVGVISNLKLGNDFDFRFNPGFSFAVRRVRYTFVESEPNQPNFELEEIQSNYLTFPFIVRYKSQPYQDLRIYVLGGVKYSYDLESNSRNMEGSRHLRISPHDYLGEIGVGFQFFFPFFILSPEIKFSHSLDNINIYDRNSPNSGVIEKILARNLTLTLHFEG